VSVYDKKLFGYFLSSLDTSEMEKIYNEKPAPGDALTWQESRAKTYLYDPEIMDFIKAEFESHYNALLENYCWSRFKRIMELFPRPLPQILDDLLNERSPLLKVHFMADFKNSLLLPLRESCPWFFNQDGAIKTFDEFYPGFLEKTHPMPAKPERLRVVQGNALIEAHYKLPLLAHQVMRVLISMIKPEQKYLYGQFYQIEVGKFAHLIGRDDVNHLYAEVKAAAETLLSTKITIPMPVGVIRTTWIASYKYHDGTGVVDFCFSPMLEPYLLNLKERFTQYHLQEICPLKNQYSIRIYEILRQYAVIKKRTIPLEKFKNILGVTDVYELFANIQQKILKPVHSEITTKTSLSYDWRLVKTGRKVTAIEFHDIESRPSLPEKIIELIPEAYRKDKTLVFAIYNYLNQNGQERTLEKLRYVEKQKPKKYLAYTISAFKNDFTDTAPGEKTIKEKNASPTVDDLPDLEVGTRIWIDGKEAVIVNSAEANLNNEWMPFKIGDEMHRIKKSKLSEFLRNDRASLKKPEKPERSAKSLISDVAKKHDFKSRHDRKKATSEH